MPFSCHGHSTLLDTDYYYKVQLEYLRKMRKAGPKILENVGTREAWGCYELTSFHKSFADSDSDSREVKSTEWMSPDWEPEETMSFRHILDGHKENYSRTSILLTFPCLSKIGSNPMPLKIANRTLEDRAVVIRQDNQGKWY